jgi:hypothetical protein
MTPKQLVKNALEKHNLPFEKLTTKTNSLGLFVYVHGWKPNPLWTEIEKVGKDNGFYVMTKGDVF